MSDLAENYRGVFDGRVAFGRRPAVVVVDFIAAYTTPGSPLYAPMVVDAIGQTVELLAAARRASFPVVYTRGLYHPSGVDGGVFLQKVPVLRQLVEGNPLAAIDAAVAPKDGDLVIAKNYASAFFGTTLDVTLRSMGVDTIVLVGCSTSGCIRATAVDAIQHGFPLFVPRECVGDRHAQPHDANLFDIGAKYGEVVTKTEILDRFRELAQ